LEEVESFAGEIPTGYDEDPDFDHEKVLRKAELRRSAGTRASNSGDGA
jgi:hypothetical protein